MRRKLSGWSALNCNALRGAGRRAVVGRADCQRCVQTWSAHRDRQAAFESLQREKAQAAAVEVSRFTEDILRSLDWVTLSAVPAGSNDIERRRLEFLKLLRLSRRSPPPRWSALTAANCCASLALSQIASRAALTCQANRVQRCAHNSRSFQRRSLRRADRTVLDRRGAQCRTRWISRHCRRQP